MLAYLADEKENWLNLWQDEDLPEWAHHDDILHLISASNYAAEILHKYPEFYGFVTQQHDWPNFDFDTFSAHILDCKNETTLFQQLRTTKHQLQLAFIYDVTNRHLSQTVFLKIISRLAASLVEVALKWQHNKLSKRLGQPFDQAGKPIQMCVFAMGKFGGEELNFSSDIDLIFAYAESGETRAIEGSKSCDHEIFFRKLAQKLIACLDQITADGFVYRVDMRLRPFGQSGPLTLSFESIENYYQLYGRDWERYALMKARPVAGDIAGGLQLLNELRPFMYRRYLDYTALNAIGDMKQNINQQIRADGMKSHIKLGRGGIREAEFSVQAIQLVYGGQYPRLQHQNFLTVLHCISELRFWDDDEVAHIQDAYLLLRTVENALQFDKEQQTHHLPDKDEQWQRLALACHFDDTEALKNAITQAREVIHRKFCTVFESETADENDNNDSFYGLDWQHATQEVLYSRAIHQGWGEGDARTLSGMLFEFLSHFPWQRLPTSSLSRIYRILPLIMGIAKDNQHTPNALLGVFNLIQSVSRRHVYLDLLADQTKLITQLLSISQNSSWLMNFICSHPLVLDDILSERDSIDNINFLEQDLSARIYDLDEEEWLYALRDFKHAQFFKIAWEDVVGILPLMQVSDRLSWVAELVLKYTYQRAYNNLVSRYGYPRKDDNSVAEFAIVGYGKLGGLELSYGSDLDLIYIYDDNSSQGNTDGKKSIPNQLFFTRLAQRITNYLNSASTSGILYEIDTRLRPSGQSGLLVNSIEALMKYQMKKAWVWEHQALTRARPIIGDAALCEKFQEVRRQVLCQQPVENLKDEVIAMRERMLGNLSLKDDTLFDIKRSKGGLVDIEFIVQYLLLKHSHQEPVIIRMSDNVRQLAALEATGIISSPSAMTLRDNYRKLRSMAHHCFLNQSKGVVDSAAWQEIRQSIIEIWAAVFETK